MQRCRVWFGGSIICDYGIFTFTFPPNLPLRKGGLVATAPRMYVTIKPHADKAEPNGKGHFLFF